MKKTLLFASCALFALPVAAQTAGETCNPGTETAPVDTTACSGDTVLFCGAASQGASPTWNEFPCTDIAAGATCEAGLAEFGDWCVVPNGAACLVSDGQGGSLAFPCSADGAGCKYGETTGQYACTAGAPTCTPSDSFQPTCVNNNAVYGCFPTGEAVYDDCTAVGGTCTNGDTCANVQSGGTCDDIYWTCASGLTCTGLSDTSFGTCQAGGGTGGGTGGTGGGTGGTGTGGTGTGGTGTGGTGTGNTSGDEDTTPSRDDEEEEAPPAATGGCAAVSGTGIAPAFALLGVLGLVARRRRR